MSDLLVKDFMWYTCTHHLQRPLHTSCSWHRMKYNLTVIPPNIQLTRFSGICTIDSDSKAGFANILTVKYARIHFGLLSVKVLILCID